MRRYASLILVLSLVFAYPVAECSCAQPLVGADLCPSHDSKGTCGCGCCEGSDSGPCMCGCTEPEPPGPTVPAPRSAERADENLAGAILPGGLVSVPESSPLAFSLAKADWFLSTFDVIPLYLLVSSIRC